MSPDRWNNLKSAFSVAMQSGEVAPDLLADDPELRHELLALVEESTASGGLLESPAWRDWWSGGADLADSLLLDAPEDEPEEEPPSLVSGDRVGGYTVRSLIGRGGMGEVYRAEQASPRREVALKVIRAGLSPRRVARRLELEAAALARLHHPGIAAVIEAGVLPREEGPRGRLQAPRPFFSMELVEGVPVTVFASERRLNVPDRLVLMRRVCEAVAHAHQRGVIHRDLKPANILVDNQGRPKVLDFGVARIIDREAEQTLTQPGWVPGTLAYMSPEQAAGDADAVDTRSDVYALGVVLYELLAGRRPISNEGRSQIEMLRAVREDQPPRLGSVDRALRGDIELIVEAALHKDPAQRYPSAAALAEDLGRVLMHEPLAARRPGVGYVLGLLARRHWKELGVAAAALLVGLSLAAWQFTRAVRAERLAQQRLGDVRRASREMVTDLYDKLWSFSGIADVRVYLAGEAARRLDAIVAASGDDPAALWDLSTAIYKLGMSSGHPGQSNAGHREAATSLITRALAMRERLLAMDPGNKEYREGVAATSISLWQLTADPSEASRLLNRGVELYKAAAEGFPDDLALRDRMAYALAAEGWAMARHGAAFDERFEQAKAICETILAQDPQNNHALGTLGTVLSMHAAATRGTNPEAAIPIYESAKDVLTRASEREPNEYSYVRHISRADWVFAEELWQSGRAGEARAMADAAMATHRRWFAKDPTDSVYRVDLVDAIMCAANARLAPGAADRASAQPLLQEAHEILLGSRAPEELAPHEQFRLARLETMLAKPPESGSVSAQQVGQGHE